MLPSCSGVSRRQDWPRLDLGLERPKFLLVDEVDGIAPGLMVRHLLPKLSGPLDIPEPLEASAPLHTKLAVELALQVAIAEGAEPIELVVRIGFFREPRIDPREGISSGAACRTYLFEEGNFCAALREMVGDGAPQNPSSDDADTIAAPLRDTEPRKRAHCDPAEELQDLSPANDWKFHEPCVADCLEGCVVARSDEWERIMSDCGEARKAQNTMPSVIPSRQGTVGV